MKSYWNGKEEIWVLNGESDGDWKKKYVANVTKSETATFAEDASTTLSGDDYLAIYPAEPAASVKWNGNIQSAATFFWLDPKQTLVAGSYDPRWHIAVAYAEAGDENLHFKNVNSLVKFTIGSDNVTEVCFYGNNSEKIAGNFNVNYNSGNPTVTNSTEVYAKVTGSFEKSKTYYISVLPSVFNKGFSIEFVKGGKKYISKVDSKYTLSRNQILDLKTLNTRTIYLNAGSHWDVDGAKFMAHYWKTNNSGTSVKMSKIANTNIYKCQVNYDADNIIFVRKDPNSSDTDFGGEWGRVQTTLSADYNLFTMKSYSEGYWGTR